MLLTRRGALALGSAGLLMPRRLFAGATNERKFLFLFNPGGWDITGVFAPVFNETTDHFEGDEASEAGGLPFVDSPVRPSVRTFFENWGSKTCMVNGLQVPSVAHDVCTLLMMTGESRGGMDDWVSIVAGNGQPGRLLPNIHMSGPIFPHTYVSATVRVGLSGQLPGLVTGAAFANSDVPMSTHAAEVEALQEAFVRRRLDAWEASTRAGFAAEMAAKEQLARTRAEQLPGLVDVLTVQDADDVYDVASVIVRSLAAGLSRTGVVAYGAGGNGLWDTHSGNEAQSGYFESVFSALDRLLTDMDATPGEYGGTLLDETTVVVMSEMGRTPQRSASGGKDHWTYTSTLLIGSGIAGGRTVGAWSELLTGEKVDLASGDVSDTGVSLLPGHIGATLLALADIDPAEFVDPAAGDVIEGILA
jgi:uncharacterized protein (DUF1501 family)